MTVIVWDGATMACDTLEVSGYVKRFVPTKIFRLPDGSLFAGAGEVSSVHDMLAWLNTRGTAENFPKRQTDSATFADILRVLPDGEVLMYGQSPHPRRYGKTPIAIGAGAEVATACMLLGLRAPEAAEMACRVVDKCGGKIVSINLETLGNEQGGETSGDAGGAPGSALVATGAICNLATEAGRARGGKPAAAAEPAIARRANSGAVAGHAPAGEAAPGRDSEGKGS